jgi:hypothetical protein
LLVEYQQAAMRSVVAPFLRSARTSLVELAQVKSVFPLGMTVA